jgi:hypothetical protein
MLVFEDLIAGEIFCLLLKESRLFCRDAKIQF